MLPNETHSALSPDSEALSKSVFFWGWRSANTKFQSWAKKMAHFHESTWRKAGIFEAVMSSTYKISKNTDIVLGIAEKWCPDTKTFVFPWGETAITLEDVMVLLGFSVLGSPVFATLDSSGEKIMEKLDKEWKKIKKEKVNFVSQVAWMERFMNSGDELEHVAFLVLWLNYFVFPSRLYHLYKTVLPIAVHLSCGTRIALAPAVLAHLYADLSLLKNHITDFGESTSTDSFGESTSTDRIDLTALFKLVQVWTWERFKELKPRPNPLFKGEPRLALWHSMLQRTSNARQILDNSKIDSFEWRPYTKTVKKWEFPKFYPEEAMWAPAGPNLDDVFISFARCTKVSALVGIDNVEHYFPDRVASQFGMLQDVPCAVNKNKLSHEAAWNEYNKPVNDLRFYIPSRSAIPRVTPTFCEWWRKTFPEFHNEKDVDESAETLKARNSVGDYTSFVPSGSKMNRKSEDHMKIPEHLTNKRREHINQARDRRRKYMKQTFETGSKMNGTSKDEMKIAEDSNKRRNYMKQAREHDDSAMGHCQTQVLPDNDEEDDSLSIAQFLRLNKKKYSDVKNSGRDFSEPLDKRSTLEAGNNDSGPFQKVASIRDDGDETVPPPEQEKINEETDEIGSKAGKNMVEIPFDENNSSEPPFDDIVVSPPETRQTCDDELDVYGSNAEKNTMVDDGSKKPDCLLHEDGIIIKEKASSDEKLCSSEAEKEDDDSLIQKKLSLVELALKADNNEPNPHQKLASGDTNGEETSRAYRSKVLSPSDESNIHITVREGTWGQDSLHHDNSLKEKDVDESAETLKSRNIIGDDTTFVPSGSKMNRKSKDQMKIADHLTNKRSKQARDKRRKYMKQARENGSKMNRTSKDEMKIAEDSNNRRNYMKQARDKRLKYMKQARDKRLEYMKQARKNGSNELAETLKSRNIIGDDDTSFVLSGSKVNRTSKDGIKIAEDLYKRRKYMKRARENDDSTMGRWQTQVHSDNDEEDYSLSIAQFLRLNKKKYSDVKNSGRDFSEALDKKSTLEAGNNDSGPFQKVASMRDDRDATLPPPEKDQRNEETDEIGSKAGKNMVERPFDENNSSEPPSDDIVVSPPETRQTCDEEFDVHGSNAEKRTMVDDGSKKPDCLLHEDGIIAGEKASSDEKLCSSEAEKEDDVLVDDDSLIQKKLSLEELALKADNNEPIPHEKLASGDTNVDETSRAYKSKVLGPSDESNIHIIVREGSRGQDSLHHDNALGNEETMKSSEQLEDLEKRNNDFGEGDADNDSYENIFQELKERIIEAQRNVAELKERSANNLRKIASARWI